MVAAYARTSDPQDFSLPSLSLFPFLPLCVLFHNKQMEKGTSSKMITLKSNDGEEFEVSEALALQFGQLTHSIEDRYPEDQEPLLLPMVTGKILKKLIDYCMQHAEAADALKTEAAKEGSSTIPVPSRMSEEELRNWDERFIDVDNDTLIDLILAAYQLNIKGVVDLTSRKLADKMRGKTVEEIRQTFNIKNDYTAEEEREIRNEYSWAFG